MGDISQIPLAKSDTPQSLPPLDLDNIQGDILEGLAKKRQTFFFFRINKNQVASFRTQLAHLIPFITSAADARRFRGEIKDAKKKAAESGRSIGLIDNSAVNLSFSQKGLNVLGITDDINDEPFKKGQQADAVSRLGDRLEDWDEKFKEDIHGVFLVTGNSRHLLDAAWNNVKHIFHVGQKDAGIEVVKELVGHTRPGAEDGHEHFGFNDGLTQPSVKDITLVDQDGTDPPVRQGIALVGREGDNGVVTPPATEAPGPFARPAWAIDGSFLAFRYLKQLVPEFDDFLERNALEIPIGAPPHAGADLLGARLVGRWKSGAPIDLTPIQDDPSLAIPGKNQAFRFEKNKQEKCPFAAHIRKTNPRADLDQADGTVGTEARRILRRGIAFGPEVTPAETKNKKSSSDEKLERGLLFACYQSNIANGFEFIQQSWVNNKAFPFPQGVPEPGFDPLIGVPLDGSQRRMVGTNPKALGNELDLSAEWVISRGGEYFFSPSISSLKGTFAKQA
ncbi:putative Peroxidase TAP [Seiridium unicorne]|uniref:Peroxidase TAP n=1 Tax=Seiridium unicorne TaxID=138068 RepID=A0ABR2UE14_9PEZI